MNMNNLSFEAKSLYTELVEPFIEGKQFKKLARGQQRPVFSVFQATADLYKSGKEIDFCQVSWAVADEIYNVLPTGCKNFLKETGKAQQSGWFNPVTGKCDAAGTRSTHERGILFLKRYLSQRGVCEFSGVKCKGPGFMVVDHMVELGADGGTDHVGNWAIVNAELNSWKKAKNWNEFIGAVNTQVLPTGEKTWNAQNEAGKNASAERSIWRARLSKEWTIEEIKNYLKENNLNVPNKHMEYIGRNIGIRALATMRKKANGQKRTGGSERNYSMVLNALRLEYLFGSEDKAQSLYGQARLNDKQYLNDEIDALALAECHADVVEGCSNPPKTYNRATLISRIVKSRSK
jgi:hypothetical protein